MKSLKIRKLFYGKYPYKIECHVSGAYLITRWDGERIKHFCLREEGKKELSSYFKNINKKDLFDFYNALEPYLGKKLKFRTENNVIAIYLDNKDVFDSLSQRINQWVNSLYEPANEEELDFLLNSNKKIICSDLPYGKYKYKVYLKYHTNLNTRQQFKRWITNYGEKIKTNSASESWFDKNPYYPINPQIYVEDQAILSMIGLFLGNNLRKVEEYITRSSINTTLCQP
jgi:hypothetical protein